MTKRALLEHKEIISVLGELILPIEKRDPIPYENFDAQQGEYILAISRCVPHSVFEAYYDRIVEYVDMVATHNHTEHDEIQAVQNANRKLSEDLALSNGLMGELTGQHSDQQDVVAQSVLGYLTKLANSARAKP